eukprot:gene24492-biopygen5930
MTENNPEGVVEENPGPKVPPARRNPERKAPSPGPAVQFLLHPPAATLPPPWSQDTGAGVARAWRGRGADCRHFLAWVARAWRGHGPFWPVTPVAAP